MRALFLYLAGQERFKHFALKFAFFRKMALRFIAGENLDDALKAVHQINQQKISGTLDLLGEETKSREDAIKAREEIIGALDRIASENADCTISLKLTQLGLGLDPELCREHLLKITEHAREKGNFARVDMEDSRYTQRTLEMVISAHEKTANIGAVIQAYLYRSEKDAVDLLERGIRIRLVKGAYREPVDKAFRRKKDTDANYIRIMKMLLLGKTYNAIATHDPEIIREAKEFARLREIARDRFEFQMLYGIRRDLQEQLTQEGYRVRIYIPYGRQWYPYFMRRLAERPANAIFIVRNLLRG